MPPPTRILVVEDEADLRTSLSYSLRAGGYEVREAGCGEAALQGVAHFHPELVVLDIMLPDMSGFEVCRRIRASAEAQPAVVMLTAKTQELDRVAGFEVGADDCVSKPFSIRELMLRIEARLKTHRPAHHGRPRASLFKRRCCRALTRSEAVRFEKDAHEDDGGEHVERGIGGRDIDVKTPLCENVAQLWHWPGPQFCTVRSSQSRGEFDAHTIQSVRTICPGQRVGPHSTCHPVGL